MRFTGIKKEVIAIGCLVAMAVLESCLKAEDQEPKTTLRMGTIIQSPQPPDSIKLKCPCCGLEIRAGVADSNRVIRW
jgi:hypothetical protein